MPKTCIIANIIRKRGLAPGQPMINMFGGIIEESVVLDTYTYAHVDRDFNRVRIIGEKALTGEEINLALSLDAFRALVGLNIDGLDFEAIRKEQIAKEKGYLSLENALDRLDARLNEKDS